MPHQATKGSDLHVSLGWREFCHSLQILSTGLHALLTDMKSQIVNLALEGLALLWLEVQVVLSEGLKHNAHAMEVLFLCLQKDNYVIKSNKAVNHIQFAQAVLQQPLECSWHITQPKQHVFTLQRTPSSPQ